ncbi:hypothetical protein PTKIN_Ptkin08bG0013100 [Pterospermum kingtungense]
MNFYRIDTRIVREQLGSFTALWATLGIKNDKSDSISGGLFKAFQSKGDERNQSPETSRVLQANPAALSRSINFHESS